MHDGRPFANGDERTDADGDDQTKKGETHPERRDLRAGALSKDGRTLLNGHLRDVFVDDDRLIDVIRLIARGRQIQDQRLETVRTSGQFEGAVFVANGKFFFVDQIG